MSKPDWSKAPEWAKSARRTKYGTWLWCENSDGSGKNDPIYTLKPKTIKRPKNPWIKWSPGDQPQETFGKRVKVKFRNGETDKDFAGLFYWGHTNNDINIVAYKVMK